jgi:hypothetical protein
MELTENCAICAEPLADQYCHSLDCGAVKHTFHYECLMNTYKSSNQLRCPYCRTQQDFLPIVNGLKNVIAGVHYKRYTTKPELQNTPCQAILKQGKRKGEICNAKCQLGSHHCKRHTKKKV